MNLIDKEFMPLSEVSIVETPDKDAHVLIENFGEVRRTPMKTIGGGASGVVKLPIDEIAIQPDENGMIEFCKIEEAEVVQEYINKYKNGSTFMISVDMIEVIKKNAPEILEGVPEGFEAHMESMGEEQMFITYDGEMGTMMMIIFAVIDAVIVYGWTTNKELWDSIKNFQ